MSADVLRKAAALMRERAEAATSGPWEVYANSEGPRVSQMNQVGFAAFGPDASATATHIASWHPAVALAVADWLDSAASMGDVPGEPIWDAALAVARTYLGESS